MHQFTDEALILTVDKLGEHDALVQLFTLHHGLIRGVVKRGLTSKHRADLQPATLVNANCSARLAEHLTTITLEAQHSFAARVMHDPLKLAATGSAMSLIALALAERDAHPDLYRKTVLFLQHVAAGTETLVWLSEYVRLELALLEEAGFGLDLSCCAATGAREDLVYVSPKSGRAVSREAGAPYHARMLTLPSFMLAADEIATDTQEILAGTTLTSHFIDTRMLPALHRTPPRLRHHFISMLTRSALATGHQEEHKYA